MVNILQEQQVKNKQLLNEIELLKKQLENKEKQLAEKEQNSKLEIQNVINDVKEKESPEIAGTLMTLEQQFLPKNINELTLENFVKGCAEWTLLSNDNFSYVNGKNKKLEEKVSILEPRVVELEKINQKLEEELELERETADCHLDAIDTCKDWYFTNHVEPLNKELANKSNLLLTKQNIIERKDKEIGGLWSELRAEKELLRGARKTIEKKDELLQLANKPLPKIPSKFKIFKSKIKTKFQHLIEKVNHRNQELVAQVEVRN